MLFVYHAVTNFKGHAVYFEKEKTYKKKISFLGIKMAL